MKKINVKIFIVILLFGVFYISKFSYAQTWVQPQDQIKENTNQIQSINEKITDLKDNYRLLYDGSKNQNDQLGNQISFANHFLCIISLFFTFIGIFFAFYINYQYTKVKKIKDTIDTTKRAIEGHATDLYKKLKREETLSLLERLKEVPEDVSNISVLLLSRDLLETDFLYLKEPYLKIKSSIPSNIDAESIYMTLLIQHFPYESLKDQDLKDKIISNINIENLNNMFSRDVKNFFDQIFRYLKEFDIDDEKNKTILKHLFYNYSISKFSGNLDLQNYIQNTVTKHQMKTTDVAFILKEQAPTNTTYTDWIDLIFI